MKDDEYCVFVWETEEYRDLGESIEAECADNFPEAKAIAESYYYHGNAAAEVRDKDGKPLFSLPKDEPKGYKVDVSFMDKFNEMIHGLKKKFK